MFQISNVDDAKPEWNLNETHIIIPMIDGDVINKESDKILTNSLTLNSLEVGDQAVLNNAIEHSFVIGLDKNLFETPSYKSDLVIIQNSDLKLLSCNNDLKNPIAYALSYVDQDKNEILWQTPVQKDKICDKTIVEMRDEIDYQQLERSEQINLVNIDPEIASQVSKADEIFNEGIINEDRNEKSQFINYLTVAQNSETVPNLQYLDSAKSTENSQRINEIIENSKSDNKDVRNSLNKTIYNDIESKSNESEPVNFFEDKTEEKDIVGNKIKNTKDGKFEKREIYIGVSDSLLEKSLPLKKKAKMKRTVTLFGSENQRSLLKQDVGGLNQVGAKSISGKKTKQPLTASNLHKEQNQNDSDSPSINKITRKRKTIKLKNKSIKYNPLSEGTSQEEKSLETDIFGFDKNKFHNIFELIDGLRKCRMINASIWQILNSGLKEMNVDILKEMNAKKEEKGSSEGTSYSPQLKAFALVLYFKQPAAFNYLAQVYETGWPSLEIIKDWKRRINNHQRSNFAKKERSTEQLKS